MERWERGLYRVLNAGVGLLLRSPLHGLVSGRIMLLTITGRRSGRSFTVPVGYLRYGEDVISFTSGNGAPGGRTFGGRPGDGGAGRGGGRRGRAVMVVVGPEVPKAC